MKTSVKIVTTSLVLISVLFLSGCDNTQSGIGKDVEKAGQAIQDAVPNK